jgi:hypothetical protein
MDLLKCWGWVLRFSPHRIVARSSPFARTTLFASVLAGVTTPRHSAYLMSESSSSDQKPATQQGGKLKQFVQRLPDSPNRGPINRLCSSRWFSSVVHHDNFQRFLKFGIVDQSFLILGLLSGVHLDEWLTRLFKVKARSIPSPSGNSSVCGTSSS